MSTFEIFNIFNMPVPVKDPVTATDELPSMVAWYILETSSIPVNLAQKKYVLFTPTEKEHLNPLYGIIVMSEAQYKPGLLLSYVQLHCL